MGNFSVVRMPTQQDELHKCLDELSPFLQAMYTDTDFAIYGDCDFVLDQWLFLWDTDTGYFVTHRDDKGKLLSVAMITQFKDIWSNKPRVEIQRVAVTDGIGEEEVDGIIDYLVSVRKLLNFDYLFYIQRDADGNEYKRMKWRVNNGGN